MNFLDTNLPVLLTCSATDIKDFPEYGLASRMDWRKVPRFLEGTWPTPWPKAHFLGESAKEDSWWLRLALKAKYCVVDVETEQLEDKSYSGKIIQVGIYPAGGTPAIYDRVVNPDFDFLSLFLPIIRSMTVVAHNTPFDVARIHDNYGVDVWQYKNLQDTILMHHVLYAEFPHGLEFLLSVYSEHGKAKHLGVGSYDYLVGDIVGTAEAYESMLIEFASDQDSARIYYEELLPLMVVLVETMHKGVAVDADFIEASLQWLPQQMEVARKIAEAYAGYPVSLESGPQMRVLLDEIEDVFGAAKKLHTTVKKELTPAGEVSLDKDTITALRNAFLPVEFNEELDPVLALKRIADGAHPLLEAKSLWGRARILQSNYIKPLLLPLAEVDGVLYYDGPTHVGGGSPQKRFEEAFGGKNS